MRHLAELAVRYQPFRHRLFTPLSIAMTCFISKEIHRSFPRCAEHGAKQYADGLGMLVGQAAHAVLLWHGVLPQIEPVIKSMQQEMSA